MNHDHLIEVLPHGERESLLDQVQDLEARVLEDFGVSCFFTRPLLTYEQTEEVGFFGGYMKVQVSSAKANLPACGACTHGRVIQADDMWTACRSPDCGPGARVRAYVRTHINSEAEDGIEPS